MSFQYFNTDREVENMYSEKVRFQSLSDILKMCPFCFQIDNIVSKYHAAYDSTDQYMKRCSYSTSKNECKSLMLSL